MTATCVNMNLKLRWLGAFIIAFTVHATFEACKIDTDTKTVLQLALI